MVATSPVRVESSGAFSSMANKFWESEKEVIARIREVRRIMEKLTDEEQWLLNCYAGVRDKDDHLVDVAKGQVIVLNVKKKEPKPKLAKVEKPKARRGVPVWVR